MTAPLPDHFAASMAHLGFHEADGDLPLNPGRPTLTLVVEKQIGRAHV